MREPFRVIGHSVVLAITPFIFRPEKFITQGGEGRGKTNKKRKATKSEGRGLEVGGSAVSPAARNHQGKQAMIMIITVIY